MTLNYNKEIKNIFLTTKTKAIKVSTKVDIIVSPEFYWVRKFEIPVKTETQARHVLPTLFEDVLDDITTLTYQVKKIGENLFLCFAYNNKKIYEAIKELDIPTSNISSFYFAQNECQSFNSFEVDNQKYMYTDDGILVKVPNNLIEDAIALEKVINSIKLSSYKLQIKLYNDVLSGKFYSTLFVIFGVLILINAFKYYSYSNEIDKTEEQTLKIREVNNLPSSILQTNSILKKYDSIIVDENKKREAIFYIFNNAKFDLKSLNIDEDEVILEYLSVNKSDVEKFLSKKFKNLSFNENSFSLKVSIKL